jgi:hypothetical protein
MASPVYNNIKINSLLPLAPFPINRGETKGGTTAKQP